MAARYLVPALAVAGRAVAQCSISASGTTTIQSQGDATSLAACSTFSGSIAIATGTTGTIALDGIKRISGSLIGSNVTGVTSLSGMNLAQIDDNFELNTMQGLTSLTFPVLTAVDTIEWIGLPNLNQLTFADGVQTASTLNIQNTNLQTLQGINLAVVDTVTIVNNNFLTEINMQLGNVTDSLTLGANGMNCSASFPNLLWANTMVLQNLSSINIPSLASTNSSLGFYSNFFDSVSAPNLTSVGGDLTFDDNPDLTNISMPALTMIMSGFQVANNTALEVVDGFAKLATVGGALNFGGNFTEVVLPGLKTIRGAFNLASASDITDNCTTFQKEAGATSTIQGKFTCKGLDPTANTDAGNGTSTSGGSASATSSSAANAMVITGATGLLGVVAAVFGML